VAGVCGGCGELFGAADGVAETGLPLIRDREIENTSGALDLSAYLDRGYRPVTF
jgi:hypothetical protein